MYGFTGYATNTYGTSRQTTNFLAPVIALAMRVLTSTYGTTQTLMLKFRKTTLTDPDGNINTTLTL